MDRILEDVEWGGPTLSLLSSCRDLLEDLPAVMHIRHSERPRMGELGVGRQALLTPNGKQAAYEFGGGLPSSRRYMLYYTYLGRTEETAQQIHQGILDNGGQSKIGGELPLATILDVRKYDHYVSRDTDGRDTDETAKSYFHNWVSGRYPPWIIYPSRQFTQRMAAIMVENLRSASSNSLDIYISHDTWISAFLYHWSGIPPPSNWIGFLDGFTLQLAEERMNMYFRGQTTKNHHPYWWNFK